MLKNIPLRPTAKGWTFAARLRARAFGPRSSKLACQRVKEAVSEIKAAARADPVRAGEGVVLLFERLWPALLEVDTSSGALGTATHHAVHELVDTLIAAPVDDATLDRWLERLWDAIVEDGVSYLQGLEDRWGEVCRTRERASRWVDRLLPAVRAAAEARESGTLAYATGTAASLSAMVAAGRHEELRALVDQGRLRLWSGRRFVVESLVAEGRKREALEYAEASRDAYLHEHGIDARCEEILLSSGLSDEAYRRYAFKVNAKTTRVATLRAIAAKYPEKPPETILRDLVASTPGEEGKWFAAAKELGLFNLAIELANKNPADPKTLNRAARDHLTERPAFALEAALASILWIALGYGYELTTADVLDACDFALKAGEVLGKSDEVRARITRLLPRNGEPFVRATILRRLER